MTPDGTGGLRFCPDAGRANGNDLVPMVNVLGKTLSRILYKSLLETNPDLNSVCASCAKACSRLELQLP